MTVKMKTDIKIPKLDFKFNKKPVAKAVARKLATRQKQRLRKGIMGDGKMAPKAKDDEAKKPLRRTDQTLKSIGIRKDLSRGKTVVVGFVGYRSDPPSGRRGTSKWPDPRPHQLVANSLKKNLNRPMLGLDDEDQTAASEVVQKKLNKLIEKKGGVLRSKGHITVKGKK